MSEYYVSVLDDDGEAHDIYVTARDAFEACENAETEAIDRGIRFSGVDLVEIE